MESAINQDQEHEVSAGSNDRKTGLLESVSISNVERENTEKVDLPRSRTYIQRTFGPMKEGSIRGGIFTLSSLALGTGAFSIPIRCTQVGCVWYLIAIFLGSLAAYWSLSGMIKAGRKVNGQDYSASVLLILGKVPAIIIDIIIIIYLFGVFVQYQVIIFQLIGRSYYEIFIDPKEYKNFDEYEKSEWDKTSIKFPIMFITCAILIPFCLLKDISKMRFTSLFGICALTYSILVVIIESPWFWEEYKAQYKEDEPKTHANWFDISRAFKDEYNFFTAMATVFFIYSCHPAAFPIFKSLKDHTEKRINKVFFRSVLLDLVIYLSIAFCGFITAPTNPQSLIIFREKIWENDLAMTIAKIALALDLILSIPANYASFRCSFFSVFYLTQEIDNTKNFLTTIPVLLVSTLIGALYKDILSYISFLGGFCSAIICFLIPGSMILKTSDEKMSSFKNIMTLLLIILLVGLGWAGGVITIKNNIEGKT